MTEYDIGAAFKAIEEELMASMIRNMDRHRAEETKEGIEWSQWQAEQLKALEKYKRENQKKYSEQFKSINKQIETIILQARAAGNMDQEIAILQAIKNGFKGAKKAGRGATAEFFKLNDRKLEALIKATTDDMKRAEIAVLRKADDDYRKAIYNAQVYANTGAGTYEKAVDMATRDMLSRGLNCVEYANGARHTLSDYADMAIRTASKRAYLAGEGEKRKEWGIATVIVNKRGNPCPKCLPFCGKVLIDDVWSGGSRKDGPYPLMSTAVAAGLYHPRCKDSHTTYFPGISTADDTWTKEQLAAIGEENRMEAKKQYSERQEEKYSRLARYSLDEDNQKHYAVRREEWKGTAEQQKTAETVEEKISKRAKAKEELKQMRFKQEEKQIQLKSLEQEEKQLTQKIYFDMTGTNEEMERLKNISTNKKLLKEDIQSLEAKIYDKQDAYKSEVEKRLTDSGVIENIKLSKRMTPETVDELETTLIGLKEKYGIMPKGVVYSPLKVSDSTATYNWIDDTIYLSNKFNDSEKYMEFVKKSEDSLVEYNSRNNIVKIAKERLEAAEKILSDKGIKGYEREKAHLQKAEAEIQLNVQRMAVRENLMDSLKHEYGHFIHRHVEMDYVQKKNVFGAKELGGRFGNGDWIYDINKQYSAEAKIRAASISKYATQSPYETFAEGFLAMDKGQKVPKEISDVIDAAMKKAGAKTSIAKASSSGIMNSGARIVNTYSREAEEFAEMYYKEIRSFSTDAKKIANNLGKSELDIQKIKAYLFEDNSLYDPDSDTWRRFDPDCAIAQSWQRLMTGKDIKQHDRTMIEHELLEMQIKKDNPDITHYEAHEMATKKYDYRKEAAEYYGNLEKHQKDGK